MTEPSLRGEVYVCFLVFSSTLMALGVLAGLSALASAGAAVYVGTHLGVLVVLIEKAVKGDG